MDPRSYATTLLVSYTDAVGHDGRGVLRYESYNWAPETIRFEIESRVGDAVHEINFAKIMAAVAILTTDRFWTDTRAFNDICLVLGNTPIRARFEPTSVLDAAWGVTEAAIIDHDGIRELNGDVRAYVAALLDHEGFLEGPDVLGAIAKQRPAPRDVSPVSIQASRQRERDVEDHVRNGMTQLARQLDGLELRYGDAGRFIAGIDKAVSHRRSLI